MPPATAACILRAGGKGLVFNAKSDRITDAVRLLAAVGAVAADPTLLSALKSGPSAYDALKKIAAAPPPSVARLADTLAAEARALFAATRDLPPDADVLYVQMVETGMVGAPEIIAARMEAAAVTEAMVARLTDPEHRSGPMLALFRALTTPTLRRLLADKAFAADLTPAVFAGILGGIADVSAKLDDIAGQSRETLEGLALRFGEPEPEAMPLGALKGFLVEKAKDYRRLEAQVRALDDREGRIANLKAAAEDAVRALRLDEAKALIRDAIAVQRSERTLQALRDDAALVETEAEIALLENDADEAYRLLSGAAEAFVPFDAAEAFRRRRDYFQRLYRHGLRYGGSGLAWAVEVGRRNVGGLDESRDAYNWASSQNDLGGALSDAGRAGRRGGGGGAARRGGGGLPRRTAGLDRGGAPRGLVDDAEQPRQSRFGSRACGSAGRRERGCSARRWRPIRAALRVRTEAAHPVDWATTQGNLGIALSSTGRAGRWEGGGGAARRGGGGLPRRTASPDRGGAPGELGDDAEQPRQRTAGTGRAGRRGGGGGAPRRGGGCLPRCAAGLDRGGASGGLGEDAEQPRQRAAGAGRAGRRGGGGGAARRGGGGLPRRAAGPDRGGAPGGLGDDDREPGSGARGAGGYRRRRGCEGGAGRGGGVLRGGAARV